ncbi:MAG: ribonuclease P protein component [Candidatus Peribacteraceae bacterium]|nr:ribonuclease P protein component [Candidatus Peribacteraceae bacterium]
MKLLRLHGRKVNSRVLLQGEFWRGKTMYIRWLPGAPPPLWRTLKERAPQGLYVGTFASTKLSKRAVDRNRMRRRCREALRTVVRAEQKLPTAQLLLSPRSSSLTCDFTDIVSDVRSFLSFLRSCQGNLPSAAVSSSLR